MSQSTPVHFTEIDAARSMLDQLLENSRLYYKGSDYQNLLNFVVRLRNFAPFNALLLQIQKPGLNHAASARDWRETFGRKIKDGARPLLILWPFGPVALVYDLMDTEGEPLPEGVAAFSATGKIDQVALVRFEQFLIRKNIIWNKLDAGDSKAGSIQLKNRSIEPSKPSSYKINVNRNHDLAVQFSTLAHELGHLFLGHLGRDAYLRIPERTTLTHEQKELEAESTAFIVCARNGIVCNSQKYLASYVKQKINIAQLDLYQIMRAAGQVEIILGLATPTNIDRVKKSNEKNMALFPDDVSDSN